jgi:signal transduction histidine kinase
VKAFVKKLLHGRSLYLSLLSVRRFAGRNFFLAVAICFLGVYLWLTHGLLKKLQHQMLEEAALYVERIELGLSGDMGAPVVREMIAAIIDNGDMPAVVTDTAGTPVAWTRITYGTVFKRETIAANDTTPLARKLVLEKAERMRKSFTAFPIHREGEGGVAGYLIIGRSAALRSLSLFSLAMGAVFVGFIIFMSVTSYNVRINERSNLWVALAKETAHQLGTPISALMGWVEYLRSTRDEDSTAGPEDVIGQIEKICGDMENDLKRLRRVSTRFSHIGSIPVLRPCDINQVLNECMEYYKIRLPLLRRKIEIRCQFGKLPLVNANGELLEWVFENLLRNSVDAIHHTSGTIEIRTEFVEDENVVRVYHTDNGSGIKWEAHKKIFSPGYTTKKRGWGLGLTLAKRIVEDYHKGRIFVHWSKKDKGTVFCVELPVDDRSGHRERSRWFTA